MKTCIFTVIKDEQDYLDDFIKWHLGIGIDTIFIYEDIDSMPHNDIVEQYKGNVILKSVTELLSYDDIIQYKKEGSKCQHLYIKNGLKYIHDNFDYDWCFSIDSDEFITPTDAFPSLLSDYNGYDAIMLQWKNFGANGLIKKPKYDKPIWEIFTKEGGYVREDIIHCRCTKVCYNMNRFKEYFVNECFGIHVALCKIVKPNFSADRTKNCYDRIYIRHYVTRSWEEYVWKIKVRGDICDGNRKISHFFEMNKDMLPMKDKLIKKLGEENEMEQPS